jgi:hypothetical protein
MNCEDIAQEYERISELTGEDVSAAYTAEQKLRIRLEAFRWRNTKKEDERRHEESQACTAANRSIADANVDAIEHRRLTLEALNRNTEALLEIAKAIRDK